MILDLMIASTPTPPILGVGRNAEGLRPSARPLGFPPEIPLQPLFEKEGLQGVADAD
jgi:hypothetical protein